MALNSPVSLVEISHQAESTTATVPACIRITRDRDIELAGHIGEELLLTVLRMVRESARVS
jgi:hypothetical protein